MRKINKIEKRLKHEQSERKKARFLKKIGMLQKEIEQLTNGSKGGRSARKDESPLVATPVKTSPLTPSEEVTERTKMAADARIQDWKAERRVHSTMRGHLSPEKPKEDLCENGLRMNVFEKLGLLNEEDDSSVVSTSSDSSPESEDRNNEDKLEYETQTNTCNRSGSENHYRVNDSKEVPKRKQGNGVFNGLSAKRRCKTLPRKVVWKYLPPHRNIDQEKMEGKKLFE